jgi:spore coat protein A
MNKRKVLFFTSLALVMVALFWGVDQGWAQTPQIPLPGSSIPQFVTQLPVLDGTVGTDNMELLVGPSSSADSPTELFMKEFLVPVLPATTPFAAGTVYNGTSVFGYRLDDATTTADTYIGPVLVTSRGTPSAIKYINKLGTTSTTNVGVWKYSVDQTLHWANPNEQMGSFSNYQGPIPAVPHKHGGEEPAAIDGGPDAWFLSDPTTWGLHPAIFNTFDKHGPGYYTYGYNPATDANNSYALYRHLNQQEAGPLWFHDHLLGGTRINVYAGLAGAALQIDPDQVLPTGMNAVGLNNGTLDLTGVLGPTGANTELTIPLVIQDRSFDTTGQLYFHDVSDNPDVHPFWVPEFVGDVIVVNGKSWPNLNVEAKRYRFLIIEGSNARPYELFLVNQTAGGTAGPPIWVIGTDGGYLDTPVMIDPAAGQKLRMMPGERYQIMIDFAGLAGSTLLMRNTARAPYDKGTPPQGSTTGRIMQFTVTASATGFVDNSYDPSTLTPIRTGTQVIQRLVNPPGTLNVTVAKNRQLTLNEVMGPGGPLEILVNNTKWSGKRPTGADTSEEIPGSVSDGIGAWLTETPDEGTTELWEIINLTADAHPIHTHLTQFQILDRQKFNVNKYTKAYAKAFPAGYDFTTDTTTAGNVFVPAYGPPMAYNLPDTSSPITGAPIVGGNPDITPYLQGMPSPALPQEAGWKDTAIMFPGQVTRIAVRYAPLDTAPGDVANYPFTPNDPNLNASGVAEDDTYYNYDYVWHCHIVDHEDNEMMRPYQVTPAEMPTRTKFQGTDY